MAEANSSAEPNTAPAWPGWTVATAICLRFWSRLPVPQLPGEDDRHARPDFRQVPRALPFAALIIALPATFVLLLAGLAKLDGLVAAALALTALAVTTGAFHEDGLADTADGLFGGQTPERRLEIMKDSRVGSYGAMAIGLSLLLRASLIAMIMDRAGPWAAAATLLIAAPWSRSEGMLLLAKEAPARSGGTAAAVGRPSVATGWIALGLSLALALALALAAYLPLAGLALGLALAHGATVMLARLAHRLIGGQTGDIVGAAQQLAETAIYLGLALGLGWPGR
ncbi:adenosylcobinamide-GDP ribazoletransferase [Bosea sp. (in: a-proteobacteria)]|uniref:adenosylcobinamide-GDP ribazoletransferase n=1 Tax=Bosea sp. (in: a-proteobacteria) TaxID=1871050 RepID=UPI0011FA4D3B|nr:adenosylcobinamide-GDP ribazoletransferase [Bosea sp. (in: a-proteobacteria)]TAJ34281.1 MAG: adenosylcobinamide-GDP ribazoletransferase [Bosea sp. (in: a-proteobacteria)]